MRTKRLLVIGSALVLPLVLTGYLSGTEKKKLKHDACAAPNTSSVTTPENLCGSATTACEVNIKRSEGDFASVTPSIAKAKGDEVFWVKVGTKITYHSTSKNTGFMVDFGAKSPFDEGSAFSGGADKPVTLVAKKPGCYTYSVGACTPGTVYGMCGESTVQFIVAAN